MPFYGGLRLIKSCLLLDIIALIALIYNIFTDYSPLKFSILLVIYFLTWQSIGFVFTKRWPITSAMIPYMVLYILKNIALPHFFSLRDPLPLIFDIMSSIIVILSTLLTILFPTLTLRPVRGKYKVGVVDFYLPINPSDFKNNNSLGYNSVKARLLYPTNQITSKTIPYFETNPFSIQFINSFVQISSPPPLKKAGFLLHNWLLIRLNAQRNAIPIKQKFPVVVFSHGLIGSAEIYSYMGMSMAANGNIVLMITHSDGSAPLMELENGTIVNYTGVPEIRQIRNHTAKRGAEFRAAVKALIALNEKNINVLESLNISFVKQLCIEDMTYMGHSYGGGTAIQAAALQPELVTRVAAFDPVCDWLPDNTRRAFFDGCSKRNGEDILIYDGGIEGYENENDLTYKKITFENMDFLVLYSNEFTTKEYQCSKFVVEMMSRGRLGRKSGINRCETVSDTQHPEFSDVPAITPIWASRMSNIIGKRNPLDTLDDCVDRTLHFISDSKGKN